MEKEATGREREREREMRADWEGELGKATRRKRDSAGRTGRRKSQGGKE